MRTRFLAGLWMLLVCALGQGAPITLHVDATGAPRRLVRAKMHIPTQAGKVTLMYPKWIPGEHGPTGPIGDVVGLKFLAGDKKLAWQRDPADMFAFNIDVPQGADAVDVELEFFYSGSDGDFSAGASTTEKLLCLSWNHVVLYPAGAKSSEVKYAPTLKLPQGWKFGTALPVGEGSESNGSGNEVSFAPVSLETLVDSPLVAGEHFRTIELTPGKNPPHYLHLVADSAAALEMKEGDIEKMSRLIDEARAMFGGHHYRAYHFLLTLSDHVNHFGLEHHESSDNRLDEKAIIDENKFKLSIDILPHELVHSWCGKYRRPADIATADFQQPMKTELLWVYEGLTTYLGDVLALRSGLNDVEHGRESIAMDAARLDQGRGRDWRPLADTAVAAQLLYGSGRAGSSRRRGVDFYPEGKLIWLDADVLIRQKSGGKRSLDDFCRKFFGGESEAKVVPYTLDDVIEALNEVAPHDWREFFQARVYAVNPRAPIGGIEGGGWKLAYKDDRSELLKGMEGEFNFTDVSYALGFSLGKEGDVGDVIPGSVADRAGMAAGMKMVAVNGRKWSPEVLRAAIKSAKGETGGPIELLIENKELFRTFKLDHRGGERYPVLERDKGKADLLGEIFKPVTYTRPATAPAK